MIDIQLLSKYLERLSKNLKKGSTLVFRGQENSEWKLFSPHIESNIAKEDHLKFYHDKKYTLMDSLKDINFENTSFISFSKDYLRALYYASRSFQVDMSLDDIRKIIEQNYGNNDEKISEIKSVIENKKKELDGVVYIAYLDDYNSFEKVEISDDLSIEEFIARSKEDKVEYIEHSGEYFFLSKDALSKKVQRKIVINAPDKAVLRSSIARIIDIDNSQSDLEEDERIFLEAKKLQQNRRFLDAIKKYTQAIDLGFADDETYYNLGTCYYNLDEFNEAIKSFEKIRNQNEYLMHYMLLDSYLQTSRYNKCFNLYIDLRDTSEESNIAIFEERLINTFQDLLEEALIKSDDSKVDEYFSKIKQLQSEVETYIKVAQIKEDQGRISDSVKIIEEALQKKEDFKLYLKKAHYEYELNRYDESIATYNKALEFHVKEEEVYIGLSLVLFAKGEYIKSLESCNKAIQLNPNNPNSHSSRADIYFLKKEYDKAIEDYNRAISMGGDKEENLYKKAKTYEIIGNKINALEAYNEIVAINPKSVVSNLKKVYIEYDLKKYTDSRDTLNFLIPHAHNDVNFSQDKILEFYKMRAHCNQELKVYKNAMEDYEYILGEKYDSRILIKLAEIYGIFDDSDKALEAYKKLLEHDNSNDVYLYSIAEIYKKKKQLNQANDFVNRAIMSNSNVKEYYFLRGEIRRELKRYSEAILDFDKAILIDNNFTKALIQRGQCKKEIGQIKDAFEDFKRANAQENLDDDEGGFH